MNKKTYKFAGIMFIILLALATVFQNCSPKISANLTASAAGLTFRPLPIGISASPPGTTVPPTGSGTSAPAPVESPVVATPSAPVATPTALTAAVVDYCPSNPVRATINAALNFQRVWTDDIVTFFGAGETFVIQVNVTDSAKTIGRYLATINFSDAGSQRGNRYVTFSKSKCDFTSTAQWVSPNFKGIKTGVNAGSASISIGTADTRASDIKLSSIGTWYLNIQNIPGGCPVGTSCHTVIDWAN